MPSPPITESTTQDERQFVANGIRLSSREWLFVALVFAGVLFFAPSLWNALEEFEPGPDYRVPHASSEDYWQYARWARLAASEVDTLVVGDSVVWGEYVTPEGTLTHHLNDAAGKRRFANLGLAGMHPVPLAGLIEHYGGAISGRNVILHCNLLWMSSPRHDLREEKEFEFNHPLLAPQFVPRIPCYRRSVSVRIGNIVKRNVEFFGWTRHLQITYFDEQDLPAWMLDHPRQNPLGAITLKAPPPERTPRHTPISWMERRIRKQDFAWTELATSLQWRSFRRAVDILKRRNNRLVVVVGPFNEHLLTQVGQDTYDQMKSAIEEWLKENEIPYVAPPPLPSELYADASHPLAGGYARLALELLESPLLLMNSREQE